MTASEWILVTAGLGSKQFVQASNRLAKQANGIYSFKEVVILNNENLEDYCSDLFPRYSEYLNSNHKGYGYMAWKSSVCEKVFSLNSDNDNLGIVWIDSGCEIETNKFSRFRFRQLLKRTKKHGYLAFTLKTKERQFTKKYAFNFFPSLYCDDPTPQFQTTFFMLHGSIGRAIVKRWNQVVCSDKASVDESKNTFFNGVDFVTHRHDQSIFSLTLKEMKLKANLRPIPGISSRNIVTSGLNRIQPVKAFRNRSGNTLLSTKNKK